VNKGITMKVATQVAASMLALGGLLGMATSSHATDIAELPLKTSVLAKPNVIVGFDDSGSMDTEIMLNTSDGMFWWNFDTGRGWDATGAFYRHINLGEYWSSTWRRYVYLFPNGNGGGLNIKPENAYGDWSLPPTSESAWARSSDYNPQYYNPAVEYKPWARAQGYAAFTNATPSAARGHPIYGGAGNVVDLTNKRAANQGTSRYFTAAPGMALPAGASVSVCNSTAGGCAAWTAVGAADTPAQAGKVTRVAMDYWPATYWVKAAGAWDCVLPAAGVSVGTRDCTLAPDGLKLRRIEIRATNLDYPSGRSYAAELQNFANWFQYHRKRRLSANAGMGATLEGLTGLRMGVIRFNGLPADGSRITMYDLDNTNPLNNGQAVLRFLYDIDLDAGTPTRATLRRIGHEFLQSNGPIQYACQRNAALIVTDGYAASGVVTPPAYNNAGSAGVPYQTTYAGTLADIALSYYSNKLGNAGFPSGKVPPSTSDPKTDPHMNTYALTLGAMGDIFKGEATPVPVAAGAWVNPNTDFNPSAVDDLWHATINGRGKMYLATAASETALKLSAAFTDVLSQVGAQGGVAVSTVNLPRGDSRAYFGTYNPAGWAGDLTANVIDPVTGSVNVVASWSAAQKLLARDWTTRIIATSNGAGGVAFSVANVAATVNPAGVYGADAAVINYLRGDRSGEGTSFRTRTSLMGAVINSEPVVARDESVVYVASGEGMLHAFDTTKGADEGKELWAFVPRLVLPTLGESVERGYAFGSKLDGSPVVGKFGNNQKLLVAGMGVAGNGYYALDVSSPRGLSEAGLASKWKWEFPAAGDAAMQAKVGQTLGRPVIVKTADDGYVVLLSSGYNSTADGKGRLWMLNANTGAVINEFTVAAGALGAESGLAQVAAFGESDGTVRYVYGGDLLGNLWRFDLKLKDAPFKLASLVGPGGAAQPVTAAPELLMKDGQRIVLVGTGRLLDITDFGNANVQSIYAIADGASLNNARNSLVKQTYVRGATPDLDTLTANAVDWSTQRGWYIDLPAGEQINTRPTIAYGGLAFISNLNGGSDCSASSYLYVVDVLSGKKFVGTDFISTQVSKTSNSSGVTALLTTGQKIVGAGQDADGKPWERNITSGTPITPAKNSWLEIRR
jgi:type IV pilus assembly protein PilY1